MTASPGQSFVAGVSYSGQIANFLANDGATDAAKYTATVDWGDGTSTTAATIQVDPSTPAFDILASPHTYRTPQSATLTVQINDAWDASSAARSAVLAVADQPLSATTSQPSILGAVQGSPIASQDVATFTSANPQAIASDFNATIRWGDGTSSADDRISKDADGIYHILGGHTYQHPSPVGGYQVNVSIGDGYSTLTTSAPIPVAPAPLALIASPVSLTVGSANAQGQAIVPSGTIVGTFTQAGQADAASTYMTSASFVKFAGSPADTPVTVTFPSQGGNTFTVTTAADAAIAPYLAPGQSPFSVQIADAISGALSTATGSLNVADVAPIASSVQPTVSATAGRAFSGPVVGFSLPFAFGQDLSGQYSATIDWGDGTPASVGAIRPGATPGIYTVSASHTYADIGTRVAGQAVGTEPITVDVRRAVASGALTRLQDVATIADAPIVATAVDVFLTAMSSDSQGNAIVPAGMVVGSFTQNGLVRLTTAYPTSSVHFAGASVDTPLILSLDPTSGIFTARTASATVIPPYLQPGSTPFTLNIADGEGGTATSAASLRVADIAPIAASVQPTVQINQGRAFSGPVAVFGVPFAFGQDLSGQYSATIDWGDGTPASVGAIRPGATPGIYTVSASHTYADIGTRVAGQAVGTEPITVDVRRAVASGALTRLQDVATIADAPIVLAASPVSSTVASADNQGRAIIPAGVVVATFTQPLGSRPASAFAGSSASFAGASGATPLTISPSADGVTFVATTASATLISPYLAPGQSPVTVRIIDGIGGSTAQAGSTLTVTDVAPIVSAVQPTVRQNLGGTFSGPVAGFSLPFAVGQDLSGQYSATIDWGDGTPATVGTVRPSATPGAYIVSGSHAYASVGTPRYGQGVGTFPITVSVTRAVASGAGLVVGNLATVVDAPISVAGQLSLASDSGPSALDAITNIHQPTFTGASAPGSQVTLVATPAGSTIPITIGQTTTGGDGSWSITASPLADGSYTISVVAVDAVGLAASVAQILPNAGQGPLVVASKGPVVAGVLFDRNSGRIAVTFSDPDAPIDLGSIVQSSAYRFSAQEINAAALRASSPVLQAYDPSGHSATVLMTLNGGRRFPNSNVGLTIASASIRDLAGNSLDQVGPSTESSFHTTAGPIIGPVSVPIFPRGPKGSKVAPTKPVKHAVVVTHLAARASTTPTISAHRAVVVTPKRPG